MSSGQHRRRTLVFVSIAAVLVGLCLPLQGADITVINSPDTDCTVDFICDFQTALDFADTIPAQSDTLFLEPGMYNVPVDQATVANVPFSFESFTDRVGALTIIGSGTDRTILNGVGASKALLINTVPGSSSVDFTIHDLSIVNGNSVDTAGGGLDVRASVGDITIVNCVFSNSISGFEGGGLHAETASGGITVTGSIFNGNSSGGAGGGAFINSTGDSARAVTVGDTLFEDNGVTGGGSGGGLFAATAGARLGIVNGVFLGNGALEGGGAFVTSSTGTISAVNNIADKNAAANRGGGSFVEVNNGRANLTNNTFVNSAAGDAGGGVFIEINGLNQSGPAVSSLDVFNSILWMNNSVNPGKDIALDLTSTPGIISRPAPPPSMRGTTSPRTCRIRTSKVRRGGRTATATGVPTWIWAPTSSPSRKGTRTAGSVSSPPLPTAPRWRMRWRCSGASGTAGF
jgi:hypothetical protein